MYAEVHIHEEFFFSLTITRSNLPSLDLDLIMFLLYSVLRKSYLLDPLYCKFDSPLCFNSVQLGLCVEFLYIYRE